MSRTMDTTSSFEPKVLMSKGKRATAAYIHADCSNNRNPQHLNEVLDNLLNPQKAIDEWETIDWCKWLMAGGRTPDEFASTVRAYDNATTCGLVWTPNFVAYRCRTCGISPCMSLCTECFKKGNHFRHDFNMFLSQAGGACDCGDTSVMKEAGFCDRHGPNKGQGKANAPADLMCVGEAMMPRIILRLLQHLRENSRVGTADSYKIAIQEADAYISMLLDFNNMGGLMRKVITSALTNPQKYQMLNEVPEELDNEYAQYQFESRRLYEEALRSMPNPEPADEFRDYPSLQVHLVHRTFLEELVFWNVKFEFPQKVVCLLLNMLPDPDYKEPLTRALILHYTRIAMVLETSSDPDTLSNRVVHVSVQLFSNESLALRMAEQLNLLQVMVISLKYMMNKIMIKNMLHDVEGTYHYVVDCAKSVMKEHCYWPLVSDLNNVLSHRPVTVKFLTDEGLLEMWFSFLNMFQGMNFNEHELNLHVEFEPNTYYAAFSAELEASAYPMWAMLSHLTDESTAYLSRRVLGVCVNELRNWFAAIAFNNPMTAFHNDNGQVSFHLPLHRYLATFIFQAVTKQNVKIKEILPSNDNFVHLLMMHPLRVQVVFYEILNCYWLRNGLQIKGQAMTYIQCNFCNSMVDADIFLLQVCSSILPGNTFFNTVMDKFHVKEWTSMVAYQGPQYAYLAGERDTPMLPSFLTFITSLICIRTGLGLTETDVNRLEMLTLLCMSDKTHSQLMDLMPERSGVSQSRDFESVLADVADYRPMALEASGNMKQGMYSPKAVVWNERYDPIHVLLRAVHRKDFQTSMDRYTTYAQKTGKIKADMNPWPPYRTPADVHEGFDDPRQILRCRVFHALAFIALYKTLKGHLTEHAAPMIVFLLEQAVLISNKDKDTKMCSANPSSQSLPTDMDLETWYPEDSLYDNLKTVIGRVVLTPEPEVSTIAYSSDSDLDWDTSETDNDLAHTTMLLLGDGGGGVANWTADGEQSASREMMVFRGTPNDVEMPNSPLVETPPSGTLALPSMSMEVDDESSVAVADDNTETPSPTDVPALPPPVVRPALTAGNEVGRTVMDTSNRELVPTSSQGHRKPTSSRRKQTVTGTNTYYPPTVKINESLISLLLKLHSQYTGRPDSFTGEHDCEPTNPSVKYDTISHFGDGAYYIGRLLTKISEADSSCKKFIQETRRKLWPTKQEAKPPCETEDKEERRRRAKERQEKLMREFAERQKEFMQRTMETNEEDQEESVEPEEVEEERMVKQQEYHCVICNRETPSTEDHPMGLIILVQSTGVVGHKKKYGSQEVKNLPLSDDDKDLLLEEDTLSAEYEKRLDVLSRYFDPKSWFLSVNIGWDSGVHVITCGHHLHLDCLHMYMVTLIAQAQRHQNLQPEKGEYFCPLCRQISNSALPLLPQLGDKTSMVRSRSNESMSEVLDELSHFLRENDQSPSSSKMAEAIGKVMDDMSSMTRLEGTFKPRTDNTMAQSLFLFVTSIARTNLEVEMLLRGGSLVMPESVNPLLPRRECMVPLLHVLAVHARVTRELSMWPSWMTFQQLCGLQPPATITTVAPVEREVPLLLRDPIALLLQFVLLLPLHLDQTYFTTTVQMVYNLLYYQVVAQTSCGLSNAERMKATTTGSSFGQIKHLSDALGLINERLGQTELYGEDDMPGISDDRPQVNILALEQQVQKLLLPYLRIASLLKFHLYQQPLPEIRSQQSEFVRLVYYLELVTESMDWGCFNAAVALNWPAGTTMAVDSPRAWTEQLAVHVARNQFVVRGLLREQHALWITPRLLQLPREYEKIFSYYHEKPCKRCQSVAAETSICLLCGTIVCLKQNCCKRHNVCEAVTHAAECGAGTGVFLVVTSTYIIVIRGPRACLWGSLYLDDFEEEDRDLKRGKPLYLSKVRFQLLEQQWLSHRFNHTRRSWVLHRNAL